MIPRRRIAELTGALTALAFLAGCGGSSPESSATLSNSSESARALNDSTHSEAAMAQGRRRAPVADGSASAARHRRLPPNDGRKSRPNGQGPDAVLTDPDQIRRVVGELGSGNASKNAGGRPAPATAAQIVREMLATKANQDRGDGRSKEAPDALMKVVEEALSGRP
jgi:hypothetical protein